jgi:LPXTG-site transpeptidase (sortase) family protein
MKHKTITRVALIATLFSIAVIAGIVLLWTIPDKESNLVDIQPADPQPTYDVQIIPMAPKEPDEPMAEDPESVIEEEPPIVNIPSDDTPSAPVQNCAFSLFIDGSKVNVAYGVDQQTLEKSPGWLENSAYPGEEGTCVVYGHRNRNHLKALKNVKIGDTITVCAAQEELDYVVESIEILAADDPIIIPASTGKHLMLSTCYPFNYSGRAPQKCVVVGRLN